MIKINPSARPSIYGLPRGSDMEQSGLRPIDKPMTLEAYTHFIENEACMVELVDDAISTIGRKYEFRRRFRFSKEATQLLKDELRRNRIWDKYKR